jgi:hypothetical protein
MPYALCPMPHAQCPRVPHLSEKGYRYLLMESFKFSQVCQIWRGQIVATRCSILKQYQSFFAGAIASTRTEIHLVSGSW